MVLVNANREVHDLLRDGYKGSHTDEDGVTSHHTVRFVLRLLGRPRPQPLCRSSSTARRERPRRATFDPTSSA